MALCWPTGQGLCSLVAQGGKGLGGRLSIYRRRRYDKAFTTALSGDGNTSLLPPAASSPPVGEVCSMLPLSGNLSNALVNKNWTRN